MGTSENILKIDNRPSWGLTSMLFALDPAHPPLRSKSMRTHIATFPCQEIRT
jgi:hypothetical protein